jgi:membrane protein YdbS with pleckstrin-like domain
VLAVLVAGEILIPAGKKAAPERLALAVAAAAALTWWLLYPVLRWRTTVYELTNKRMRLRDGILTRRGRDIPLSRITDVSFRKGLLDRLVGSGTLIVESAGEHGELTLTAIPHVEHVQSMLFQLVEDERLRADRDERQAMDLPSADRGVRREVRAALAWRLSPGLALNCELGTSGEDRIARSRAQGRAAARGAHPGRRQGVSDRRAVAHRGGADRGGVFRPAIGDPADGRRG